MKIILNNDISLNWLGRWAEDNGGKYSGWGGSTLKFKFSGTSLSLEIDVKGCGGIAAMIDDYSDNWTKQIELTQEGVYKVEIVQHLDDKEHTAMLRFRMKNYKKRQEGTDYIKVKSILIDDNAIISRWNENICIGYFGDSWAAAYHDCLRFLSLDNVDIYSVSESGYTAFHGLVRYPYVVGNTKFKDPIFNMIILGYGVNDSNHIVLKYNFIYKRVILALIKKIRQNNPDVKIILLQSPRNYHSKKDYSKYGHTLQKISETHNNCDFISSGEIENKLTWSSDGAHLDTNGKHIYGEWLGMKIKNYL
jgi:hypothetical protein